MFHVEKDQYSYSRPHFDVVGNCNPLKGSVKINGAKNSALVLMAASILTKEKIKIKNIPSLSDISVMKKILQVLGVKLTEGEDFLLIDPENIYDQTLPKVLVHSLRASFFCIGPLLVRLGKVQIPLPGGCNIGTRPVDEHIKGLRALGAEVKIERDMITASLPKTKNHLTGTNIYLSCPSVGATETLLMAACISKGKTTIKNAAKEPEVQDLAEMLNRMGADIKNAGSNEIIINGVDKLKGCTYTTIPDRIEAGTFLIAAAITKSNLKIGPVIPEHLKAVIEKLIECGCIIEIVDNIYLKIKPGEISGINIKTEAYPGFPTDLQAPFMSLMATAKGKSEVEETIFENRMQHVEELKRMGAQINLCGQKAFIKGVPFLTGNNLKGTDLRSTAALILAAISANGLSQIRGLNHLDRGYEAFEKKLSNIGVKITREQTEILKDIELSELATQNNTVIKKDAA